VEVAIPLVENHLLLVEEINLVEEVEAVVEDHPLVVEDHPLVVEDLLLVVEDLLLVVAIHPLVQMVNQGVVVQIHLINQLFPLHLLILIGVETQDSKNLNILLMCHLSLSPRWNQLLRLWHLEPQPLPTLRDLEPQPLPTLRDLEPQPLRLTPPRLIPRDLEPMFHQKNIILKKKNITLVPLTHIVMVEEAILVHLLMAKELLILQKHGIKHVVMILRVKIGVRLLCV
jgi:hypothetical protein